MRDAAFAGSGACVGCHEFAFPSAREPTRANLMQSTIAEHAESPVSDRSCADCHMPLGGGRRGHGFAASRVPDEVRKAVHIAAERTGPTTVRVTLLPRDLGHAFPTGDLFRRIEISAEVAGPDEIVLASANRYLARHFAPGGRHLLRDDRVTGAGTVVDLDAGPPAAGRMIVWRVAYQRVAHPSGIDESEAVLEDEIVLAGGRLSAP